MIVLSEFIANYVKDGRIVEVGAGFYLKVAMKLKEMGFEVLVVDKNVEAVENAKRLGLNAEVDDVFNPRLELYEGVDVIYSIRPTPEMMPALVKLSKKVNVPMLIVPLTGDSPPNEMKLVNYKGIPVYIFVPKGAREDDS
ncbi:hypothetical protein PNA2_0725 [Pyrococcus sp. NA2]|uniref:UPF0146 family protein n=1 Tax=Pyrococcus sp. (strain NA2) TaxID=342949 RepID=UPI000209ADE2|nr:UPF0146 family protein [Pyrococcus sp. NA2]AEC51641.1 hypothetical protein PNA2_0725 [Pyrococcus sp. NA2]